jgi:hypothetical protein
MPQYRVTIAALAKEGGNPAPLYEQVVENLNIKSVIAAVNRDEADRAPIRHRAPRSDRGKKRADKSIAVGFQPAPAA